MMLSNLTPLDTSNWYDKYAIYLELKSGYQHNPLAIDILSYKNKIITSSSTEIIYDLTNQLSVSNMINFYGYLSDQQINNLLEKSILKLTNYMSTQQTNQQFSRQTTLPSIPSDTMNDIQYDTKLREQKIYPPHSGKSSTHSGKSTTHSGKSTTHSGKSTTHKNS
jgi:hypothetical protein